MTWNKPAARVKQWEGDEILDDVLSRWHSWARSQGAVAGHARTSAGMEMYRASRQHDDQNGALDSDLEHMRCKQVDFDVRQMPQPHQTAIYVDARNLCTGVAVWGNPRLPSDPEERAIVVIEARSMLTKKLLASGVL